MPIDEEHHRSTLLVGGVAQLYQGDLDVGRRIVERLQRDPLGGHVAVEDLYYGALAVAQRLQDLRPAALILVGACERGRQPGTIHRREVRPAELDGSPERQQIAVGRAVTGSVAIDLILEVGHAVGALPAHVVTLEVEPASCDPGDQLSPPVSAAFDALLALTRSEIGRIPVLG